MKRFNFRLESVLKLRAHKEEKYRNILAAATQKCNGLEMQIEMLAKERVNIFHADAGDDMSYHLSRSLYLGRIEDKTRQLETELVTAQHEREQKAQEYRKVRQDFEAVKRLKERKVKEYRKAWFVEEGKEIDDIANSRVAGGAHG